MEDGDRVISGPILAGRKKLDNLSRKKSWIMEKHPGDCLSSVHIEKLSKIGAQLSMTLSNMSQPPDDYGAPYKTNAVGEKH